MITTIYANGDSWTNGNGLEHDIAFKLSGLAETDRPSFWKVMSWPAKLASIMGAEFINESDGGGSNHRIVRMTCDFIRKWPEDRRSELLVVLGWSSCERSEVRVSYGDTAHWCKFNAWQRFSSHWGQGAAPWPPHVMKEIDYIKDGMLKYMWTDVESWERYLRDVWLMANMLENLGIKFMFFNSIHPMGFPGVDMAADPGYAPMLEYMKDPRFNRMGDQYSMASFCHENGIPLSPCIHPMTEGHQKWAEHLYSTYKRIYNS